MTIRNLSFCLLLCGSCMGTLRAQSGFVKSGNQPLPGATVTATLDTQKFVTTTDADGRYALPALTEGAWTVEVQMFGFEPAKKAVNYARTKQADFNLQLRESPAASRLAQFAGSGAVRRQSRECAAGHPDRLANSERAESTTRRPLRRACRVVRRRLTE